MQIIQRLCADAETDGHPVLVLKAVFKRNEQLATRRQRAISSPLLTRNNSHVIDIGDYSYVDNLHLTDQCLDKIVQAVLLLL
jgi:hypothetical protein